MNDLYLSELKKVNNQIDRTTYIIIILEVFYVISFFMLSPIFGSSSSTITEFAVHIFLLSMFYIPIKITRNFLFKIRKTTIDKIERNQYYENMKNAGKSRNERIFTENDRTFYSYKEYEEKKSNNQSQQKSEFYVNKNINSIIHEKELKILNLELKELKFYNKSEIKKAYRLVAKENHPDFGINEEDIKRRTEKMFAINAAYEILLNKVK